MYYTCDSCQLHLPWRKVIMKSKDKTISLRLTNEEHSIVESNSNNLNMTTSQYIRSMINNALPSETNYRHRN